MNFNVNWPEPWKPLEDEDESDLIKYWREWEPAVAPTIVDELRREICQEHPLHGLKCTPIAYDSSSKKDILFTTDDPHTLLVSVHFTWNIERDPQWPGITFFKDIMEFISHEEA